MRRLALTEPRRGLRLALVVSSTFLLAADEASISVVYRSAAERVELASVDLATGRALLVSDGQVEEIQLASGESGGVRPLVDADRVQPVPGSDRVVFRRGDDLLVGDGITEDVVFEGSALNQKERLSPDGQRVAWVRYAGTNDQFTVVVAPLIRDPALVRVADVPGYPSAGPMWGDGSTLYWTTTHGKQHCLMRGDVVEYLDTWTLECSGGAGASLVLDASGSTAALVQHKNAKHADVLWLHLPRGEVLARRKNLPIEGPRTDELMLDSHGLLVARAAGGKGLLVVDLADGRDTVVDGDFSGMKASRWTEDGVLLALRQENELVRVDARALLAAD